MAMRAGTRFRARPIDVNKKIPIIVGSDVDFDDELAVNRNLPHLTTGMLEEEEQELIALADFAENDHESSVPEPVKMIDIPIPHWELVKGYMTPGHFRRPTSYIRARVNDGEDFDAETVDYDLESDDDRFILEMKAKGHNISPDVLEKCIDRLEKETARLRHMKDGFATDDVIAAPAVMMTVMAAAAAGHGPTPSPAEAQMVYQHWLARRRKWGKALLRQFVEPPSMNDPDPKVAFRPRHKTFHRSRRRNDIGSLRKLREIRSGLDRLQMILELIRRRERLKEERLVKRHDISQARLQHLFRKASSIAAGEDSDNSMDSIPSAPSSPVRSAAFKRQRRPNIPDPSRIYPFPQEHFPNPLPPSALASVPRTRPSGMLGRIGRGGRFMFNNRMLHRHPQLLEAVLPFFSISAALTSPIPESEAVTACQ